MLNFNYKKHVKTKKTNSSVIFFNGKKFDAFKAFFQRLVQRIYKKKMKSKVTLKNYNILKVEKVQKFYSKKISIGHVSLKSLWKIIKRFLEARKFYARPWKHQISLCSSFWNNFPQIRNERRNSISSTNRNYF